MEENDSSRSDDLLAQNETISIKSDSDLDSESEKKSISQKKINKKQKKHKKHKKQKKKEEIQYILPPIENKLNEPIVEKKKISSIMIKYLIPIGILGIVFYYAGSYTK